MQGSTRFRKLAFGAACALLATCVNAADTQSSTQKSASSKPATTTKQHKKRSPASSTVNKSSVHAASTKGKYSTAHRKKRAARGQQKIDSERAQSIQQALIREHYLTGEPTGRWSPESEEAMRRYQGDHGWQTKTVPDSRALIQLGLGPSKDHLLNPESAMTTGPSAPGAASLTPSSRSADPVSQPAAAEPVPASTAHQDSPIPQ